MENLKFYYIYKTTNLINGKIYIGQHQTFKVKNNYLGSGKALLNAINFHGKENFKKEIIEFCTKETLDEREIFWIKELNSKNNDIGYNITDGGGTVTGMHHSKESKELFHKLNVGRGNGNYQKISDEILDCIIFIYSHEFLSLEQISEFIEYEFNEKVSSQKINRELKIEGYQDKEDIRIRMNYRVKETYKKFKRNPAMSNKEIICPYCNFKSFSIPNMDRYHFGNCKLYLQDVNL
jgi:group I intron endonuclease